MNIYIYGDMFFRKEIFKILSERNLKKKIAQFCSIVKVDTPDVLKEAILSNPTDIYLIDHKKIIIKNFFTNNIKLLNPKDAIEDEFLKEHGIGDLSVDKISDIAQHIFKRLEALEQKNEISICENTNLDVEAEENNEEFDEEFDEDELSFQSEQDDILKELELLGDNDEEENIILPLKDIDEIEEKEKEKNVGDIMAELTQLDDINEVDLIDALSSIDGLDITSVGDTIKVSSSDLASIDDVSKTIEVDSSNMDNVAKLLEQLMNNKTLEISIKVKS